MRSFKYPAIRFPEKMHLEPPEIRDFRIMQFCVIHKWPSHPDWIGIHYGPFGDEVWKKRLSRHGARVMTWHRSLESAQKDFHELRQRLAGDVDPISITYFKWAPDDPPPVQNSDGSVTINLPRGWWS